MKTLILVRHAKSDRVTPVPRDADRKLLPKGIERAHKIAQYLVKHRCFPDLIISSPAVRTRETAALLAKGLEYPVESISIEPSLYAAYEERILEVIFAVDDDIRTLMLVGHNPEFTDLANLFLDQPLEILPTTGVVALEFKTDHWNEISIAKRSTLFVVLPKLLP